MRLLFEVSAGAGHHAGPVNAHVTKFWRPTTGDPQAYYDGTIQPPPQLNSSDTCEWRLVFVEAHTIGRVYGANLPHKTKWTRNYRVEGGAYESAGGGAGGRGTGGRGVGGAGARGGGGRGIGGGGRGRSPPPLIVAVSLHPEPLPPAAAALGQL